MVELKNSAACKCEFDDAVDDCRHRFSFTPEFCTVFPAEDKTVVILVGTKNESNELRIQLEKSEAAKFGADIVAAATGVKE